jgi:FkbM family methyltransferase
LISYSQNLEDVLLARVFSDVEQGFYIDVGAHDPEVLSITKHFYDSGWHGINLEPVPSAHSKFASARPRDTNLQIAAGCDEGEAQLFIPADSALATLDAKVAEHSAITLEDKTITATTVRVRPLASVLDEHEISHIDFMAIDVEGSERAVLEGLDLTSHRPVVIVCEATVPAALLDFDEPELVFSHSGWDPWLTDSGYECVFFDGVNRFYLRDESESLKRRFAIPVGPVRDGFRAAAEVGFERDLRSAARERDRAQENLILANRRIDALRRELGERQQAAQRAELQLETTRNALHRLTQNTAAELTLISELERRAEALRHTIWARDRRLDALLSTRRAKLLRITRADGRAR